MQSEPSAPPSLLFEAARAIAQRSWLVLAGAALAATASVGLAFSAPPSFESVASFTLQGRRPAGGSAASSIAAQLGFSTTGTDPLVNPQLYVDLVASPVVMQGADGDTAFTGPINARRETTLAAVLGVTSDDSAARAAMVGARLASRVGATLQPKTGVVVLRARAASPWEARSLVSATIRALDRFTLQTRQGTASAERQFVEARLDQVRAELRRAEDRLLAFLEANRDYRNSALRTMQYDRLARDVAQQQQLVSALAQASESARIEEARNTPAVLVLERPTVPRAARARFTPSRIVLAAALGGAMVALFLALWHIAPLAWQLVPSQARGLLEMSLRGGAKRTVSGTAREGEGDRAQG